MSNKGVDSEHFLALMRLWVTKVKEVTIDEKPTGKYEARVSSQMQIRMATLFSLILLWKIL
jgi:hypothetical protein